MLKGIPNCLSPDLVRALMSMGHGDEIVLADADFPAASYAKRLIRADGVDIATLLEAILPFFPLDSFVDKPVITMDWRDWAHAEPAAYQTFRNSILKSDPGFADFEYLKRFDFYERAKSSFAIVITGEPDGNLVLKKGPVMM